MNTQELITFRMDWLGLLAVQGTLKRLLQHHSSKASILLCSAFFTVQLSHPYMTTGKTIALTRWNFVGKVRSLLLNMLSRLVITFLPRSKLLLISWLQSPSVVILEPRKIKHAIEFSAPDLHSHIRYDPIRKKGQKLKGYRVQRSRIVVCRQMNNCPAGHAFIESGAAVRADACHATALSARRRKPLNRPPLN